MGSFGLVPGFGDIEVTIAASKILHILGPVRTGADNILVKFAVSGSQPTRTAHIAITFFIQKKCLEEVMNPFLVLVKKVAFGLLGLFKKVIEFFLVHSPRASLISFSLNPTIIRLPMSMVGKEVLGLYFFTSSIMSVRSCP
jgi:hypothetical protein